MGTHKPTLPAEKTKNFKLIVISIASVILIAFVIFIILNSQINQRAIQVYNDTSTPIVIVIDSGIRGSNPVEFPLAGSTGSKRGILIDPQHDGTIRGAATLGDAPTVHIWDYSSGKLSKELYVNPPPWIPFVFEGDSVAAKLSNFLNHMFSTLVLHWDGTRLKPNATK